MGLGIQTQPLMQMPQPTFTPMQPPSLQAGGGGALGGLAGFLASPVGGLVTGGVGLVGQGLTAWLRAKEEEEAKEEAQKRYEEQLAESNRRYEEQQAQMQKQWNLTKLQAMQAMKQQQMNNDNYYDERNYNRINKMRTDLINLINKPTYKSKYQQIWGG